MTAGGTICEESHSRALFTVWVMGLGPSELWKWHNFTWNWKSEYMYKYMYENCCSNSYKCIQIQMTKSFMLITPHKNFILENKLKGIGNRAIISHTKNSWGAPNRMLGTITLFYITEFLLPYAFIFSVCVLAGEFWLVSQFSQ